MRPKENAWVPARTRKNLHLCECYTEVGVHTHMNLSMLCIIVPANSWAQCDWDCASRDRALERCLEDLALHVCTSVCVCVCVC